MAAEVIVKLRVGDYLIKTTLTYSDGRIYVQFPFNRPLMAEIKSMQGAKWHGFEEVPRKVWSIADTQRNKFQLDFLRGVDVYKDYDKPLIKTETKRPLMGHQQEMKDFCLTRRYCLLAAEMGTGKTLVAIEVAEHLKAFENLCDDEVWYVGPKSGVRAVGRELVKWNANIIPIMLTYNAMTTKIKRWDDSLPLPKLVIFDESAKVKTPTSQRSQAALYLAENIRKEYGDKGCVILMSGAPAPKAPTDWFHQTEICCPGFLRESTIHKFKNRLCLIEERESLQGGVYPHVLAWLDDEKKCAVCGKLKGEHDETFEHGFKPSINEVAKLYKRLQGVVQIKFKKDCTDLPDKQYRAIQVKTTTEILHASKLIKAKSTRTITALTLLRELSDGFQYSDEAIGDNVCTECHGTGKIEETVPIEDIDVTKPQEYDASNFETRTIKCSNCDGSGKVTKYKRTVDSYDSPKDKVFIELLKDHDEIGRFVVWGGFTGTIDRLIAITHQQGWATLRYDKTVKGESALGEPIDVDELLDAMDNSHPRYKELLEKYPKVCFVGHPDAGGTALTLHASPTALYYSNSFNGESRIQSEDRIHRMGMDANRGATIIDLIHLPTDLLVLNNLKNKKKLQNMTMNALEDAFTSDIELERYE